MTESNTTFLKLCSLPNLNEKWKWKNNQFWVACITLPHSALWCSSGGFSPVLLAHTALPNFLARCHSQWLLTIFILQASSKYCSLHCNTILWGTLKFGLRLSHSIIPSKLKWGAILLFLWNLKASLNIWGNLFLSLDTSAWTKEKQLDEKCLKR